MKIFNPGNRGLTESFRQGFTLIETLVGIAVFLIVAVALYQAYVSLFVFIGLNKYKVIALNIANEQFEIARNLTFSDVGEIGGTPAGKIPPVQVFTRNGIDFFATTTVKSVDLPFDGTSGGSNDPSPTDNKLVAIEIGCPGCANFAPITMTTIVAPRNLETAAENGALLVKVFDAGGLSVAGADVLVINTKTTPNLVVEGVTNSSGTYQVVDLPPGLNAYRIMVGKFGYSTARTHPPDGAGNPDPLQPDASVLLQRITQVSLGIDKVSSLTFRSKNAACEPVGSINFSLTGAKSIGAGVAKYSKNLVTNSGGTYASSTMEWDTYKVSSQDSAYDIIGVNPLNPISLNPNSTQDVDLIVADRHSKSLLVVVKDGATGLPVTDASVTITNDANGDAAQKMTSRGYFNQTDWSGGSGQDVFFDPSRYSFNDGNIDTGNPFGELKLRKPFDEYSSSGVLISSTIDTGGASNFGNIVWSPLDQPAAAGADSVKFQIATGNDKATTTWNFKGPDGNGGSYYSLSNTTINPVHDGDRYMRYKVLLSSTSGSATPNVADVAVTFTSSCTPPGQVIFTSLTPATYTISVAKPGYGTGGSTKVEVTGDWTEKIMTISP